MKRWNLSKNGRIFLLSGILLAAAVGLVWLLGGRSDPPETPPAPSASVSPAPTPAPTPTPVPAEETLSVPEPTATPEPEPTPTPEPDESTWKVTGELAGVWVPFMSLDTEEKTQEAFEENFRRIADTAREKGLNALFVHVRPFCDALYPSEIYPWSHILTGQQGKDPGFDPLRFMVDYTHSRGMEFHAWLNPLRVKTSATPEEPDRDNPYLVLREDSPFYFMEREGGVYLNPAYPYIRTMIADGAAEIVENYRVDGIHFDDYFYPGEEAELDWEAYELYTQSVEEPLSLMDWRRANVSAMVQEVYSRIKEIDPGTVFGISPQGNIENDLNMGADVGTWCAVRGYVDYLCPQLYYSFDNPALGFSQAMDNWLSLPRHEDLKLYIGLGLYKAGTDADKGTWLEHDDVISRQIGEVRAAECAGLVLYSSEYLDAEQTSAEMANAVAALNGAPEEAPAE